jgi:acyl-CoA thioester hydrolase
VDNPGVAIWRGGVNTWECDRMGHLNVRFHLARAMEGLVGLAGALGMPRAFTPEATATLMVREHHIRFLREALPPDALDMTGSVISMGESESRLFQLTRHTGGPPSAAFQAEVVHVTPHQAVAFPWPERVRLRAESLTVPVDEAVGPRSLVPGAPMAEASMARAEAAGLTCIAGGAVQPQDCDAFGRMRAEMFIARISDGYSHYAAALRRTVEQSGVAPDRLGTAAVEFRLRYLAWPEAGDRVELRSGLVEVGERTNTLVHWLLDPETGEAWGQAEQVVLPFDMHDRKMIALPEGVRERLQAGLVKV